jgi:hypothetical protein
VAVHFIHVSKAGGTALKHGIRAARAASGGKLVTQWGDVRGHHHRFRLCDVRADHKAVLAFRDPISRFLSGYFSGRRKGAPRYFLEWTEDERRAFEAFPTPQALADALASRVLERRRDAELALKSIRHLKRPMTFWTGTPAYLREHLDQVVYIARQETLEDDWERLKELFGFPAQVMLPADDLEAHRTTYDEDVELSDEGVEAVRRWYADDFELLEIGDEFRAGYARPLQRPVQG